LPVTYLRTVCYPEYAKSLKIQSRKDGKTNLQMDKGLEARCWWLTPVIPATQEAEIRRMAVQSQTWANSSRDLSRKILHKKGLVEWLKV
jgi:hypothetical protein